MYLITAEVGIYKRKQESKKERKHAFDQRKKKKNVNGQEKTKENKLLAKKVHTIEEKTITIKKK